MPAPRVTEDFKREVLARPFPNEWDAWLSANLTHYALLGAAERGSLQDGTRILMAQKHWEGCDGLEVTELMKLTVAAQAALLLLGLDHDYFSRVRSIVLFPAAFETLAAPWEERGRLVLGQAVDFGTVFLSWETVRAEARAPASGHNVVIHEFAHQLDFLDGYTNGVPVLRDRAQTQRWQRVMQGAFQRLRLALQQGRPTFLGDYAATDPAEFFSVASEKFFTVPAPLREHHPELFEVLAEFYRVDPSRWFKGNPGAEPPRAPPPDAEDSAAQAEPPAGPEEDSGSDFIEFACPCCGNPVAFPKAEAGTLKECPNCTDYVIVPEGAGKPAARIPFPIATGRLVLRRLQPLDAREMTDLLANPANLRYVDLQPTSLEDCEEWIANQSRVRFPNIGDSCYVAVEVLPAAKMIGLITLWFEQDQSNQVRFELIIHPDWQRQGYGTEAVRGVLAHVFTGLRVRRLVADCDARNIAARHLLRKAGLRQESHCLQDRFIKGEWVSTAGFALLKQEYDEPGFQGATPAGA